jgi:four helix bundle protein
MNPEELKTRTQQFALRVIRLAESMPRGRTADVLGKQLLRSATSVGANYRAACRARSRADFISKIAVAEEEADESLYWLELISDSEIMKADRLAGLIKEADELTAILTAAGRPQEKQVSAQRVSIEVLQSIQNRQSDIRN